MNYKRFEALPGNAKPYATCFVFDVYEAAVKKVLTNKNIAGTEINPHDICNLKETPCGIRFDVIDGTTETAKTISSLFSGKFVLACEYWNEDIKFKAYADNAECVDIAWVARQNGAVGGTDEKPEFVTLGIDFIYRRIVFGTVITLFVPYDKAKRLIEEGQKAQTKMFKTRRKKRIWEY